MEYLTLLKEILGVTPDYIGSNGEDCMAVVPEEGIVYSFIPDYPKICSLSERGFLLTARDHSKGSDYIYRGFFPKLQVPEDPVTGSANTCLAPYWSTLLKKNKLKASQVSDRGGRLDIEDWETLRNAILEGVSPMGAMEELLTEKAIAAAWRL